VVPPVKKVDAEEDIALNRKVVDRTIKTGLMPGLHRM